MNISINTMPDNSQLCGYKQTEIKIDSNTFMIQYNDIYCIVSLVDGFVSKELLDNINLILSNNMTDYEVISKDSYVVKLLTESCGKTKSSHIMTNGECDYMGVFEDTTITKYKLNKTELYENYHRNIEKKQHNLSKIPKELLLNDRQLYCMILNEIEKVNSNMSHNHIIVCKDDNILNLMVRFRYNTNELGNIMKNLNIEYFELSFQLGRLYPFLPPKVEYIKPKIDIVLIHNIINMDLWDLSNWNYTIPLDTIVSNMGIALEPYFLKYIDTNPSDINFDIVEMKILHLLNKNKGKVDFEKLPINMNLVTNKEVRTVTSNSSSTWSSGTGYGSGSKSTTWDISTYIDQQKILQEETIILISEITHELSNQIPSYCINILLYDYIVSMFKGINLLDFNKTIEMYHNIISLVNVLLQMDNSSNMDAHNLFINNININTIELYEGINSLLNTNMVDTNLDTYIYFIDMINTIRGKIIIPVSNIFELKVSDDIKEQYSIMISKEQYNHCDLTKDHMFYKNNSEALGKKSMLRIISEISSLKRNLPNNWDSSVLISFTCSLASFSKLY